jgi:aminopeptidase
MDDRIRRHAEILVDYCTEVGPEDNVLISAPTPAEDLVVALYEQLGKRGARPTVEWRHGRARRAYARAMAVDDYRPKEHRLAAMRETDVAILVKGTRNTAEGPRRVVPNSRSWRNASTRAGSLPSTQLQPAHSTPR